MWNIRSDSERKYFYGGIFLGKVLLFRATTLLA